MILELFIFFIFISLILIVSGIIITDHSELALIGSVMLFIFSVIIITDGIDYEIGSNVTTSYTYNGSSISSSTTLVSYGYTPYQNTTTRRVGYFLAVMSAVTLIGVLTSLKPFFKRQR